MHTNETDDGNRMIDPEDSGAPIATPTATPIVSVEPSATAVATEEELAKLCCICGLDVSHLKRLRDRNGYWCAHCHGFNPPAEKTEGVIPCLDCGRHTRESLMIDRAGDKVCPPCNQNYLNDCDHRLLHRAAVTAHPELGIRRLIRKFVTGIAWMAGLSVLSTLYHFHLLYYRPRAWVPFKSALYCFAAVSVLLGIAIAIQYIRIAVRKREREADYDQMVRTAANHVLALDDDSHAMGISESPEPLRRRVVRAIIRVEAAAGLGAVPAGKIIEQLAKHSDAMQLIEFLKSQRPNTTDTLARNRELATISYLQVDLDTASAAVNAILLRLPYDQDAMTRQALICFRNGELEKSKKIFKRVVHIAREKNSDVDLAAAYCNLGMLHVMLSEWDDAAHRYSQAMTIYNRLEREDGQADCLVNLGLIAYRTKKEAEVENPFRRAMAINKRLNRREGLATCCGLLGVILVEREIPNLAEAKKLLNQAVHLNLELGRAGGVAASYGNLGLVHAKQEDFKGATELFIKAQSIYQRINRPKMMAKIQGMLKTVGTLSSAKEKQNLAQNRR